MGGFSFFVTASLNKFARDPTTNTQLGISTIISTPTKNSEIYFSMLSNLDLKKWKPTDYFSFIRNKLQNFIWL